MMAEVAIAALVVAIVGVKLLLKDKISTSWQKTYKGRK